MPVPADYLMRGPAAERYYAQTEVKHFSDSATGSVFDDPRATTIEDLLDLAISQFGNLDGENPAFERDPERPGVYYITLNVRGRKGAISAKDLGPGEAVLAKVSKEGIPPDFVVFGRERPETNIATLVMADEQDNGLPTGRRVLITCHPGEPADRAGEHRLAIKENTVLAGSELLPGETVLLGDSNVLGQYTEEALEEMLGHPIAGGSDVSKVLSAIVASSHVREEAQDILFETARLEDGYYDFSTDSMAAMVRNRAHAVRSSLADLAESRRRSVPRPAASRDAGLRAAVGR